MFPSSFSSRLNYFSLIALLVVCFLANSSFAQSKKGDSPTPSQLPSLPEINLPKTAGVAAVEHARQLLETGKKQEALDELTRIIDSDSGTVDAHYFAMVCRGRAWVELGKPDKALADYRSVIDSSRAIYQIKRQASLEQLFFVDYRASDWKTVIADATRLLSLVEAKNDQDDREIYRPTALMCRARAFSETGELAKSLADYNDALSQSGLPARASVTLHLSRALLFSKMHRTAQKAEDLQWVIDCPDATEEERAAARQELHSPNDGSTTKPATNPAPR